MTFIVVCDTPEDFRSFVVERLEEVSQKYTVKMNEVKRESEKHFWGTFANILKCEAEHLKNLKIISTEEDRSVQLSTKAWDDLEHGDRVVSHLGTKGVITLLDVDKLGCAMSTEEESPYIHITWENGKKSVQCHADLISVRWLGPKK